MAGKKSVTAVGKDETPMFRLAVECFISSLCSDFCDCFACLMYYCGNDMLSLVAFACPISHNCV